MKGSPSVPFPRLLTPGDVAGMSKPREWKGRCDDFSVVTQNERCVCGSDIPTSHETAIENNSWRNLHWFSKLERGLLG